MGAVALVSGTVYVREGIGVARTIGEDEDRSGVQRRRRGSEHAKRGDGGRVEHVLEGEEGLPHYLEDRFEDGVGESLIQSSGVSATRPAYRNRVKRGFATNLFGIVPVSYVGEGERAGLGVGLQRLAQSALPGSLTADDEDLGCGV